MLRKTCILKNDIAKGYPTCLCKILCLLPILPNHVARIRDEGITRASLMVSNYASFRN